MRVTGNKGFSKEVKELAKRVYQGYCWLCEKPGLEVHHRVANSVTNNRLFPNFLHSIFNASYLCRDCHNNRKAELDIRSDMALVYEWFLKTWRPVDVLEKGKV